MSDFGQSGNAIKRASPPTPGPVSSNGSPANPATNASIASNTTTNSMANPMNTFKRQRTDGTNDVAASGGNSSGGGGGGGHGIDPDQLSDALHSAGVNLKEEEHLLSRSLYQDPSRPDAVRSVSGAAGQLARGNVYQPFLEQRALHSIVRKLAQEMGIRYINDKENEIVNLLSTSCEEWLSDILTSAVVLSRHRRRSRTDVRSKISKALRAIAIKDKEQEDQRQARKAALGLDGGDNDGEKKGASEDVQHRAANATALMMTQGKKKYSWMSGGDGAGGNARASTATMTRTDSGVRYREAREEPGLSLRDLLNALEQRRYGVENALIKGYAKVKN